MRQARADAAQVPGRAHQRVGRHRPLGRRRARGGRRRRRRQPAATSSFRDRISSSSRCTPSQLMDKVRTIPGVVDVDTNFEPTQPELRVTVDRARAADLGVHDRFARHEPAHAGRRRGGVAVQGRRRSVHGRAAPRRAVPHDPATMGQLLVPAGPGKTRQGERRRAAAAWTVGPASIDRYNRQRQISVNANLDKVPLGDVARRGARQGGRAAPEARLPGRVRRQRADAERSVERLRRSRSSSPSRSSTWCSRRSSTASSTR